ncbi:hypothetical protein [Klenkia terrae]|uniref:hypothetical protein n=1 Tax=Klenkia terrae TaxID=1052259 RepID=UPI001CD90E9D|nr:hypothetical protein [Klenkia terrae]
MTARRASAAFAAASSASSRAWSSTGWRPDSRMRSRAALAAVPSSSGSRPVNAACTAESFIGSSGSNQLVWSTAGAKVAVPDCRPGGGTGGNARRGVIK